MKLKQISNSDNNGQRSGMDRRNFTYTVNIPEKRSGEDRRRNKDQRPCLEDKIEWIWDDRHPANVGNCQLEYKQLQLRIKGNI